MDKRLAPGTTRKRDEECEDIEDIEDIMCDQVIISTDFDFRSSKSTIVISAKKLRLVLTDTLLPSLLSAYQRNIDNVRHLLLPTLVAFLANYLSRSLASLNTLRKNRTIRLRLGDTPTSSSTNDNNNNNEDDDDNNAKPEKCVQCDVLYTPDGNLDADVIFIHGLHGALYKTWRQGLWKHQKHKVNRQELRKSFSAVGGVYSDAEQQLKRSASESVIHAIDGLIEDVRSDRKLAECWPREWLPMDCPNVRVIALNYTTDPYLWRPWWVKKRPRTSMVERSKEMIQHLREIGVGAKPIIWVGHSKGGLFVKQILVDSCSEGDDEIRKFYLNTKGILFYSVPHRGSILADFTLPILRRSIELTEIQRNCQFVLDLHEKFLKIFKDRPHEFNPEVFSFIETSFTLMTFMYFKIVAYESADPGVGQICGVPLDHREICKPAGRDCFLYKELLNIIQGVLKN